MAVHVEDEETVAPKEEDANILVTQVPPVDIESEESPDKEIKDY